MKIASIQQNRRHELTLAATAYALVIAYGTLFASGVWRVPPDPILLVWTGLGSASRADMLENFLGYVPFGVLLGLRLRQSLPRVGAVILTVLGGCFLSLSLEATQVFVPGRDSSLTDVLMNTAGTLAGAGAASALDPHLSLHKAFVRFRNRWFVPGLTGNLGIAVIILWIAAQISPFIPTLDVATVRHGLSSAWRTLHELEAFKLAQALAYTFYLFALGVMWSLATKRSKGGIGIYLLLVLVILLSKPFFYGRELSLEALLGLLGSVPLLVFFGGHGNRARAMMGAVGMALGFGAYEFNSGPGSIHPFNWIPFRGEITNTLNGIMNVVGLFWVFFALAAFVVVLAPNYRRAEYTIAGTFIVTVLVGICEWVQQFVPGRYGDITVVMVALLGWTVPWRFSESKNRSEPPELNGVRAALEVMPGSTHSSISSRKL